MPVMLSIEESPCQICIYIDQDKEKFRLCALCPARFQALQGKFLPPPFPKKTQSITFVTPIPTRKKADKFKCGICGKTKTRTEFYQTTYKKTGIQQPCKECRNERKTNARRKKNKAARIARLLSCSQVSLSFYDNKELLSILIDGAEKQKMDIDDYILSRIRE
jgi:hypothetical protein